MHLAEHVVCSEIVPEPLDCVHDLRFAESVNHHGHGIDGVDLFPSASFFFPLSILSSLWSSEPYHPEHDANDGKQCRKHQHEQNKV